MLVVFRADASAEIGHGHVMRCLTLANALRERGATAHFVCRELEGNLIARLQREGFAVHVLPAAGSPPEDADRTNVILAGLDAPVAWVVVDHYALAAPWHRAVRAHAKRVMVIDDLADRDHECDVLLDQNIVADAERRYHDRVPRDATLLLGPKYALLQPAYAELREITKPRIGPVRRFLISWGGADNDDLTGRSLNAVLSLGRSDLHVDVVITHSHRFAAQTRAIASSHPNVTVHADLPTLAPLMQAADLAIGATGSSTWERLCLGLPTVAVTLADNQRAIAEELDRRGLIVYLGHTDRVGESDIAGAVQRVLETDIRTWSERCSTLVDGRGAVRVANTLVNAALALHARRAEPRDEELLLAWANDPDTRRNSFHTDPIRAEDHHRWFAARVDSGDTRIYIVETREGAAVGQVRFERESSHWRIDYAAAPDRRGQGLGGALLETALHALRAEFPDAEVMGEVKAGNRASCRVFENLGFSAKARPGVMEYTHTPDAVIAR